ncbi:hypothetical protein D3C85_319810 [compost metagenome]
MPSGKLAFKETDVARALRAAQKAKAPFYVRIERATGDILILPSDSISTQPAPESANDGADLDRELAEWEAGRKG